MKRKWLVRKLDGVWQAFDENGDLRYAADDWFTVYAFARLGRPKRQRPAIDFRMFGV